MPLIRVRSCSLVGLRQVCAILLGTVILAGCQMFSKTNHDNLKVWISNPPHSADTMEYDYYSHHCIFRSVIGTLVSQYQEGQITGVLAERWEVSDDFKHWIFYLRNNATFETGETITAEDIVHSWIRYAYLLKKQNSMSPFFSKLERANKINSPDELLPGLRADGDKIIVDLTEPFPKLLETISFGLYAVVHKNDYDHRTGLWKDPKRITSSSFYRIDFWDRETVSLSLRPDFLPKIRLKSAFDNVAFYWGDGKDITGFDIVATDSTYTGLEQTHKFQGAVLSLMYFVRVMDWDNKNHPLSQLTVRRAYRAAFYRRLKSLGYQPIFSLLPLVMTGIHEVEGITSESSIAKSSSVDFTVRIRGNPEKSSQLNVSAAQALADAANDMGYQSYFVSGTSQDIKRDLGQGPQHRKLDLGIHRTEVLIEDPASDIRFMFLSKEGVCFPDTDGRIVQELNREEFSFQRINELVWDQAVLWPVGHAAYGLWINNIVDVTHLNKVLPPLDLAWIGHT